MGGAGAPRDGRPRRLTARPAPTTPDRLTDLRVESEPGRGSRFLVELPAADQPGGSPANRSASGISTPTRETRSVKSSVG